jgi:MFS family permease
MMGLLGNSAIFAPLLANVSRWFDRRRGAALALVASGQQIGGAFWPPVFRWAVDSFGWREALVCYGIFALATMAPLCFFLRGKPPAPALSTLAEPQGGERVLGLPANLVLGLMSAAIVGCCIAMAMPMGHLVAFCSDLGYQPARGAEMLSLLLASAFLARFFWGRLSDRIGGLETVLIGSAGQALALSLYLAVDGLVGLYILSAAFGIAFGGIIPSYVLAVRQLFPAAEAGWRIATVILFGLWGMALGGWLGGWIYDQTASYMPAFATGVAANFANLCIVGFLVLRRRGPVARLRLAPAA